MLGLLLIINNTKVMLEFDQHTQFDNILFCIFVHIILHAIYSIIIVVCIFF